MRYLKTLLLSVVGAVTTAVTAQTSTVVHFDMSPNGGKIVETVSGSSFTVNSQLPVISAKGIDGEALHFDGYSNYVKAAVASSSFSKESLTIGITLAAETYPMMQVDAAETTPTFATILGNLDEDGKKGFALELSSQGDLRFRYGSVYANGFILAVSGDTKLPRGVWSQLTVVLDKAGNAAKMYLNGKQIGSGHMNRSDISHGASEFYIGKASDSRIAHNCFLINTFCGLIDDITISNQVLTPSEFTASQADFNYPAERYAGNIWRPQFHAMPSGSWMNECHGLIYSGGRYHLFFQKNANGPYMSRLHWGHLSSENLCQWTEEPIAVCPSETFDVKGCWSGCVYDGGDDTYILYTGVDNAKARIIQVKATDNTLVEWGNKQVMIDGRPTGLSDDFRDPYYFEANGNKYMIVGTAKNGIGACTLHQQVNGSWTNNGDIFFQGSIASQHGTFWEMPNVTPMGDDKWLFTCTPQGTGNGVRTLCWTGSIGSDGKFTPDANSLQYLEMNGISRDGYGLLSPSICQHDGKTLLIGIVPDKLATEENFKMGWAHNFSLPRELTLDAQGQILQRPYSGLSVLRSETSFSKELTLLGTESLSPVNGRQLELLGEFTISSGQCGFHFLKSGDSQAALYYDAEAGSLTLDVSALNRTSNDQNTYKGVYTTKLPKKVKAGETLKLHAFVDGSIADIFVNDSWAFSVRIFPTNAANVDAEAFASVSTAAKVSAWKLDGQRATAVPDVTCEKRNNGCYYDLQGRRIDGTVHKGIYIHNGKKYVAR